MSHNEAYEKAARKIERAHAQKATTLSLSFALLDEVPESLGQLSQLKVLDLDGNQLTNLPESLSQLSQLQTLVLSTNQLYELPKWLGELSQLRALHLSDNQLSTLPESLGQLSQLQELYLGGNRLTELPKSLRQLSHLQTIILTTNRLINIPEWFGQLSQLRRLDLDNNQISNLPESLGQLPQIQRLYVENNPLPSEILRLHEEILLIPYLQEMWKSRLESTNPPYSFDEAKLLLVGPGAVGKTWLLQALQGKVPQTGGSTKGLEIAREPLDLSHPDQKDRTLHLNCWDFGGQENYQITHQIFFSPKAIYLLAWKPRPAMDNDLVARLERIQLSAGQTAKVFIVSTHADENVPAVLGEDAVKERFGDLIQGFYSVDSSKGPDGTGIAELRDAIAKAAAQLEGMDTDFPDTWHKAQGAVRATKKPTLSFHEFSDICVSQGMKPESCESLAIIMDELGNAVFFGEAPQSEDVKVAAEENLVVLDPEWLAKAVTFVIEDDSTRKASGVLSHQHLPEIWQEDAHRGCPGYDRKIFGYLLWMMWKFDIAYKQNEDMSLVPELIHRDRPNDLLWVPTEQHPPGERQTTLICRIPQNPPAGLIPALTAAVHSLRRAQNPARNWDNLDRNWRDGFFLETERRGTAFVELRDRDLHIVVRAAYPRELSTQIRKTLDRTKSDRWPRLNLDYRVPCVGYLNNKPCSGTFKWGFLDKRRGKQVPCEECNNDINVDDMLVGLDTNQEEVMGVLEQLKAGQADLMVQALRLYRDVLDPATQELLRAPNMLTILPAEPGGWLSRAAETRVRVTCWCEHPDGPHIPQDAEGHATSEYVLKSPQDWLVKAAPYISWAAVLLKAFVPMVGSIAKAGLEEELPSDIKTQLDLMTDASKTLPTGQLELGRQDALELTNRQRPEIVALRHIHDALLAQVSEGKRWGELRPVRTKSGELLWLCAKHAELQQPSVQDI